MISPSLNRSASSGNVRTRGSVIHFISKYRTYILIVLLFSLCAAYLLHNSPPPDTFAADYSALRTYAPLAAAELSHTPRDSLSGSSPSDA
eukprot:CAMPEP_0174899102 /NCGR_PEP_ID=MMETSP0167-20121228/25406_1 /TAXON_ID=38298 /ORGANISM="Rhodella maculata, Strain CCMP736" /LENGTH=89 /DNA_ID=CAMNT_0016139961 /DNA_START=62 /DNA_END=327 /DNA_ORIENTATION=-